MPTETVNSGVINKVGFPGAEDGVSLIEMVGEVVATATISSITLRLTAGAAVAAAAVCAPAGIKSRMLLAATTDATAQATAGARTKIQVFPQSQSAVAKATATPALQTRLGATTAAAASAQTVGGRTFIRRSIAAAASASGSASSYNRAARAASTTATASSPALLALRGLKIAASTTAQVTHSITPTGKYRLRSVTNATGYGLSFALVAKSVGASTNAKALSAPVSAGLYLSATPNPQSAYASVSAITPKLKQYVGATVNAGAVLSAVPAALRYALGASTIAWVSSAIAAADYSVTIPAPIERQMVLPAMNRRMEVTE